MASRETYLACDGFFGCDCETQRRDEVLRSEIPPYVTHGRYATYKYWECRCSTCKESMRDYYRNYYNRRKQNNGKPLGRKKEQV